MLDQVSASGIVEDDGDELVEVLEAIAADDGAAALLVALDGAVRAAATRNSSPSRLVEYAPRRLSLARRCGQRISLERLVRLSPDELNAVRALGIARCVRTMELVGAAIVAMRDAPEPRITLEVAVFRCAALDAETSSEALLERIERLEHRLGALDERLAGCRHRRCPAGRRATRSSVPTEATRPPAPSGARPAPGAFRRCGEPPARRRRRSATSAASDR